MSDFIVKPFEVSVSGHGVGIYFTSSCGKALAKAWRCDAFDHLSFKQFLKIAKARSVSPTWERFGEGITVCGKPAYLIDANKQYVHFCYPGSDVVSNAHPFDVIDGNGEDWPYWAPRPTPTKSLEDTPA